MKATSNVGPYNREVSSPCEVGNNSHADVFARTPAGQAVGRCLCLLSPAFLIYPQGNASYEPIFTWVFPSREMLDPSLAWQMHGLWVMQGDEATTGDTLCELFCITFLQHMTGPLRDSPRGGHGWHWVFRFEPCSAFAQASSCIHSASSIELNRPPQSSTEVV